MQLKLLYVLRNILYNKLCDFIGYFKDKKQIQD